MHACTHLANRRPSRLVRSEIVAFSSLLRPSPGRSWLARLGYRLVCNTRRRAGEASHLQASYSGGPLDGRALMNNGI